MYCSEGAQVVPARPSDKAPGSEKGSVKGSGLPQYAVVEII
jgi:hypothetical protein